VLKEGNQYLFGNGMIKASNRKFTQIEHEFCVTFDKMAIIKDFGPSYVSSTSEIKSATKLNEVKQVEVKSFERIYQEWKLNNCNKRQCDIMGIITQIGEPI
jgi:hypothetical protein